MNRKMKITISSLAVLMIAALMVGTVAYFSKNFTSDNNVATAASFEVDVVNADGETIGDGEFNVGDKLYPGVENKEVYAFQIKKGNTDVPVEYDVNLLASGELFPEDNSSPAVLTLQRDVDGNWTDIDNGVVTPEKDTEDFRVLVSWPHSDHDIDFQGATGNVRLDVAATQIDGNNVEEATAMLEDVETALKALDTVNAGYNKGNFSKAQSDKVQELLTETQEYMNGVSGDKAELLNEAESLQLALDKKVESRYVYYNVIEEETTFTQLQLILSADQAGQVIRTDLPTQLYFSAPQPEKDKFWLMRYADPIEAKVGQTFEIGVRFNKKEVKTIDATFTNLGDGKWDIESDWLKEKK